MKKIQLTQEKYALVDDEDYDFLMQWKWFYANGYAVRAVNYYKPCGKKSGKQTLMHRVINKTPEGMLTDHINGDKLKNTKQNLRTCTSSENSMNKLGNKNSFSEYKGICWHRRDKRWQAQIQINGKAKHIGCFASEIEAAKAYNNKALELFGEFSLLNNIT